MELLYIASYCKSPVTEVQIRWQEVAGSKLDLVSASISMAIDLLVIRLSYLFHFWTVQTPESFRSKTK